MNVILRIFLFFANINYQFTFFIAELKNQLSGAFRFFSFSIFFLRLFFSNEKVSEISRDSQKLSFSNVLRHCQNHKIGLYRESFCFGSFLCLLRHKVKSKQGNRIFGEPGYRGRTLLRSIFKSQTLHKERLQSLI